MPELLEWVDGVRADWLKRHRGRRGPSRRQPWLPPWFRGVSSIDHRLLPTLYRSDVALDWKDPTAGEIDLRRDFARRSLPYLDGASGQLRHPHEFYFAMQHYGMVTRLLDWTESALIAAYFATRGAVVGDAVTSDGVVWALDPLVLNETTAGVGYRVLMIDSSEPGQSSSSLEKYLPRTQPGVLVDPVPEPPVALIATSPTNRVAIQRGTFTLHGSLRIGVDEFEDCDLYLGAARIPAAAIPTLAVGLNTAGITETSVYADLDGLSRELRAKARRPR